MRPARLTTDVGTWAEAGPSHPEPQLAAKEGLTREGLLLIKTDSVSEACLFFFSIILLHFF